MKNKKLVIRFNSPVILTFALLSLCALILDSVTGGYTTSKFFCVYRSSLADGLRSPRPRRRIMRGRDSCRRWYCLM